jgi:hypothetical protein
MACQKALEVIMRVLVLVSVTVFAKREGESGKIFPD